MDSYRERVRRRAYQIWLDEGRPEGREAVHWDMASEFVAIEDRQRKTTKPVREPASKGTAAKAATPSAAAGAAKSGKEASRPAAAQAASAKTKLIRTKSKPRGKT